MKLPNAAKQMCNENNILWGFPLLVLHEGLCHLYVVRQPFDIDDAFDCARLGSFHYYLTATLSYCLVQPRTAWSQNGVGILYTHNILYGIYRAINLHVLVS